MAGQRIDIGGGMTGYLAVPASGSGPGIVLLQETFSIAGICASQDRLQCL